MSRSRAILVTRPNHDLGTNYLFYWSGLVIKNPHGFKVLDLSKKKANKENFVSYINKHKPILVFLNGHGTQDTITGHDNEILIESGKNERLLAKKIVYARSCDAAKNLGLQCVLRGTISFIGYEEKFVLAYSHSCVTRPLQDRVAELFLEPSNLIPISLLKGNTVEKAYKKSQDSMLRNLHFMVSSKASSAQKDAAPYLWTNRKYQTVIGSYKARL